MPEVHKDILTTEVHTPESLVRITTNNLKISKSGVLLLLRGVYKPHGHIAYRQYYYDRIEDEAGGYLLTLRVQRTLRQTLSGGETYLFKGYLTSQARKEGHIELLFNAVEALPEAPKPVPAALEKQVRIYQRKLEQGRRNVARILQHRLRTSAVARIALIMGLQSVIENDIRGAFGATASQYELHTFRVNLGTTEELIQQIEKIELSNYDLIAIARGGAGQEIFDDEDLAYIVAGLQTPVVTAIGHADDHHLVDSVADKSFTTPSQLGIFLKTIAAGLQSEEQEAQSGEDGSAQLDVQVQQLQTENQRLLAQLRQVQAAHQEAQDISSLWAYVVLAIVVGFGLGVFLI